MNNNSPRPHEYFNGVPAIPMPASEFLGISYSGKSIKILFPKDENGKNAGKDASKYNDDFEIKLKQVDFDNKSYSGSIVSEGRIITELIGFFTDKENSEGNLTITGIRFYATRGSYPIKEEREVYQ